MAIDTVVQIIMRAKDETSKQLQQVSSQLQRTQAQTAQTNRSLQGALTMGANVARASLVGLAGAGALVGAGLIAMQNDLDAAASSIAGVSGATSAAIPEINAQLKSLVGANDNTAKEVGDALKVVYTAFKIFDKANPTGIAQLLLDWKDVTGATYDEAGAEFRRITLTYFGADADINKVLPDIADKILKVAQAVGVDPKGLAGALAAGGPTFKTAFGDMNEALKFLASVGGAGGDIDAAAKAVTTFLEKVKEIRDAWKNDKSPDQATLDAFKSLGLSQETVQNESIKVGKIITDGLKNAMSDGKLTEDELSALNFLFGSRVGEDMALAATEIDGFYVAAQTALNNYQGALEQAAQVTDDNIAARMTQAWNSLLATIAESEQWLGLQEMLAGVLTTVEGLLKNDWKPFLEGLDEIGTGLFKLLLGADPAKVAEALVWWWDEVVTPEFTKFTSNPATYIGAVATDLGTWLFTTMLGADPQTVAEELVWWWDTYIEPTVQEFTKNPIGTLLKGLGAIGDELLKLMFGADAKTIGESVEWWWKTYPLPAIQAFSKNPIGTLLKGLGAIGDELLKLMFGADAKTISEAIKLWWTTYPLPAIQTFTKNPIGTLLSGLGSIGDGFLKLVFGANSQTISEAVSWWWKTYALPSVQTFTKSPVDALLSGLGTLGDGFLKLVFGADSRAIGDAVAWWWKTHAQPTIKTYIETPIATLFKGIASIGDGFLRFAFGADSKEISEAVSWWWKTYALPEIQKFTKNPIDTLLKGLAKIGDDVLKVFFGADSRAIGDAAKWWWDTVVIPRVNTFFGTIGNTLSAVGQSIWDGIKEAVRLAMVGASGVTQWVGNRWNDLKAGFDLWLPLLTSWAGKLWESIRNGFNTAWTDATTGVSTWVGNRWNDISKFFTEAFFGKDGKSGIFVIGGQLMQGLINGMGDFVKKLQEQVNKIGGDVLQWFRNAFGIKSPSTEMMSIGDFIMQGLSDGLTAALGDTFTNVQNVAGKLLSGFQKLGTDLDKLFKGQYAGVFSSMSNTILDTLTDLGVGMDPVLKSNIKAFAGYADQFVGLLQKYKGNVLAALGDLLIGIIQQKVIELTIWGAVEVGKATLSGFMTFGASLLAIPLILGAGAAAIAGLESLKNSIRSTYGSFDVGTPYVPNDQLAQIHKGEMIVPATFAEGIRRGDVALGKQEASSPPVYVQVILDGRMVAEVVGNRFQDGLRQLVRADLRTISG